MSEPQFSIILEKKGRGRGLTLVRPWSIRNFKLSGQTLQYFDGDKLKGIINTAGSQAKILSSAEADGKSFPFILDTGVEKLVLNASSDAARSDCIEILNYASNINNWTKRDKMETQSTDITTFESITEELNTLQKEESEMLTTEIMKEIMNDNKVEVELKELEDVKNIQIMENTLNQLQDQKETEKIKNSIIVVEEEVKIIQTQSIVEDLKLLNVKDQMRYAIKNNNHDMVQECAIRIIQGNIKRFHAKKILKLKKLEKNKLKLEKSARKIQTRFRIKLAKKKMENLKLMKQRIQTEHMIHKIQCRYRIYRAKKAINTIRNEKMLLEKTKKAIQIQSFWRMSQSKKIINQKQHTKRMSSFSKTVAKSRAVITLQSMARAYLARIYTARLQSQSPQIVLIKIHHSSHLHGLTESTSDISAYVSGLILPAENITDPHVEIPNEFLQNGECTSTYKTNLWNISSNDHTTSATTGSVYSCAMVSSMVRVNFVVVTLMDKKDFLGQAIIRLSRYPALRSGEAVEVIVPVEACTIPIIGSNGTPLTNNSSSKPIDIMTLPTLTITVTIPSMNYSMCGWMYKVSESMLSSAWKKRWFILLEGQLQYFNSKFSLEHPKNVIIMKDVIAFYPDHHRGITGNRIVFRSGNFESYWIIGYDEEESHAIHNMWLRRIYRNCSESSQIKNPELEAYTKIQPMKEGNDSNCRSTSPKREVDIATTIAIHPKKPFSKRLSIFK